MVTTEARLCRPTNWFHNALRFALPTCKRKENLPMCDDTNRNFLQMRSSCGISIVVIVCNHLQRLTLAVPLACKVNIYTRLY